ncbi:uncharacterized protein G2W53_040224 [Senna tora]|uniref:Uncharacterized protein n=1 Tax=Senna tora TaxID=362788 RepID=A0A834SRS5_9FABA|nr:uncharacterized protein G2W53_040224 [Senna tora]
MPKPTGEACMSLTSLLATGSTNRVLAYRHYVVGPVYRNPLCQHLYFTSYAPYVGVQSSCIGAYPFPVGTFTPFHVNHVLGATVYKKPGTTRLKHSTKSKDSQHIKLPFRHLPGDT